MALVVREQRSVALVALVLAVAEVAVVVALLARTGEFITMAILLIKGVTAAYMAAVAALLRVAVLVLVAASKGVSVSYGPVQPAHFHPLVLAHLNAKEVENGTFYSH
jgi:hypothetical protein